LGEGKEGRGRERIGWVGGKVGREGEGMGREGRRKGRKNRFRKTTVEGM
jgi:hypothetical protein